LFLSGEGQPAVWIIVHRGVAAAAVRFELFEFGMGVLIPV
jgi:hypothetical protein